MPWEVNTPIVSVTRELYMAHPAPQTAPRVVMGYVGPNLELMETTGMLNGRGGYTELSQLTYRLSSDNGKTWAAPVSMNPSSTIVYYGDTRAWESGGCSGFARLYDTTSGLLVETWLQQLDPMSTLNHTYWRTSADFGQTWSAPRMLRYEAGSEFDPANPMASSYKDNNKGYPGGNIVKLSNGTLVTAVGMTKGPDGKLSGSRGFIGAWDEAAQDYQWTAGNGVSIASDLSSRGLLEPTIAELQDQRLLVVWRGSNAGIADTTPGRKWYSISTDGGMNLSPVEELTYDDGTQFYSPSSISHMIRSSLTGKLYWLGNITETPPDGNLPRYPLVIAEVDETSLIPSLVKDTVTIIDYKQPGDSDELVLSNFFIYENRETHAFEMYMTRIHEGTSLYGADNYHYQLTLVTPEPSSLALLTVGCLFFGALAFVRKRRAAHKPI